MVWQEIIVCKEFLKSIGQYSLEYFRNDYDVEKDYGFTRCMIGATLTGFWNRD